MINVTTRPYKPNKKTSAWEVDITIAFPDGMPPHRIRKKSPMATEKQSKAWGLSLGVELSKKGRPNEAANIIKKTPAPTIGDFSKRYLEEWVVAEKRTKSTYRERVRQLKYLAHLADDPLDQITAQTFTQLKVKYQLKRNGKERSAKHINMIVSLLYHMLLTAKAWKVLDSIPDSPTKLKEPQKEIEIYLEEELARLKSAAKLVGRDAHLIVLLGSEAGLRVAEMLALLWDDIDLVAGTMKVKRQEVIPEEETPTKGKKVRVVPLSDGLKKYLKEYRSLTPKVLSEMTRVTLATQIKRAERKAKLVTSRSPHKLRHSFASQLLSRGVSIKTVQALLGHSSLRATMVYLHLIPGETEAAIRLLPGEQTETGSKGAKQ